MATPNQKRSFRKRLKICCTFTLIFLLILVIVSVILFFTIFKPKQPQVTAHPVSLENIEFQINPLSLNVTLGVIVSIDNRNYGGFKYKNTSAYISYGGTNVAQASIEPNTVPARGKVNITTYAAVRADKLALNPHFWEDIVAGRINLLSTADLHGKVSVINIFKIHAKVHTTCDISILVQSQDIESDCHATAKL